MGESDVVVFLFEKKNNMTEKQIKIYYILKFSGKL